MNPHPTFTVSHHFDAATLLDAVDYALARGFDDRSGILAANRTILAAALRRMHEWDREQQLAGGRAEND